MVAKWASTDQSSGLIAFITSLRAVYVARYRDIETLSAPARHSCRLWQTRRDIGSQQCTLGGHYGAIKLNWEIPIISEGLLLEVVTRFLIKEQRTLDKRIETDKGPKRENNLPLLTSATRIFCRRRPKLVQAVYQSWVCRRKPDSRTERRIAYSG
ncbi:hypothetical protein RRG08_028980 [Elysia crispata]|uniref:Uncharacterized protein n=1 Tax=Elysia crispata TaxID=231223 RepID=A0AAE1EEQ4_9GAST|nr:hypothetical protein RRG08_028980 [Elysia crispata]